jgi:periplasmic divalent cation tolerance protein
MSDVTPSSVVSVYAVFTNDEEARRIGRQMVQERRAACVNILGPCHSIYRWQGRVEEDAEVPAIFKTSVGQAPLLIEAITKLHSYDVPAVVAWTVAEVPEPYRAWVLANTGK